jgi:hypothetical protein
VAERWGIAPERDLTKLAAHVEVGALVAEDLN